MKLIHLPIYLLLVATSLLFTQCKKKKQVTAATQTEETQPMKLSNPKNELKPITVDETYRWPGSTDPFDILSTEVKGDTLLVQVQYGGGCEVHEFDMKTDLFWMKSMPPKLNLYLEHKNKNDMCRAMITETLKFDLTKCKYRTGNAVVLILNSDSEKTIRYTY